MRRQRRRSCGWRAARAAPAHGGLAARHRTRRLEVAALHPPRVAGRDRRIALQLAAAWRARQRGGPRARRRALGAHRCGDGLGQHGPAGARALPRAPRGPGRCCGSAPGGRAARARHRGGAVALDRLREAGGGDHVQRGSAFPQACCCCCFGRTAAAAARAANASAATNSDLESAAAAAAGAAEAAAAARGAATPAVSFGSVAATAARAAI
mmetsp:Transcript_9281/g.32764  ORF Transcript_9281/g.32764 Transcript_9281/m.32764 type:complete len:211 (-) Transcript_9281:537-1169(-)